MTIYDGLKNFIEALSNFLPSAAIGASIAFTSSIVLSIIARRKLPIAHSVAILGFPKSGKTTLITSLFAEVFARNIPFVTITPRGESTINRVNEDIARLENGEKLGPTTDQDLFAYRAELRTGNGLFSKRYKFEVGDFPGEDTEKFVQESSQWLHESPYFKWAMEADAFVFVIDLSKVLDKETSSNYRSYVSSAFRASWQKIKDQHYDGEFGISKKPVVFVFSKSDLLVEKDADSIRVEFSELIRYFKSESDFFSVVFTSAYQRSNVLGVRQGMDELLKGVLPR